MGIVLRLPAAYGQCNFQYGGVGKSQDKSFERISIDESNVISRFWPY